jgi:GNAT superfamily N-acetyltransferase
LAFAADYATEDGLPPEDWQLRIEESTWVVEEYGAEIVGLACLALPRDVDVDRATRDSERYIESVWVAPAWRRQGLGLAMIEDLEMRARAENVTQLSLWVINGNDEAWNAYLKMGFDWTGKEAPAPETRRGTVYERRMTKALIGPIPRPAACG